MTNAQVLTYLKKEDLESSQYRGNQTEKNKYKNKKMQFALTDIQ